MSKPAGTARNLMIWTYERGTLQYDIICTLILAFIFLVPGSCLVGRRTHQPTAQGPSTVQHADTDGTRTGSSTVSHTP